MWEYFVKNVNFYNGEPGTGSYSFKGSWNMVVSGLVGSPTTSEVSNTDFPYFQYSHAATILYIVALHPTVYRLVSICYIWAHSQ